jgi:hypothetical protein
MPITVRGPSVLILLVPVLVACREAGTPAARQPAATGAAAANPWAAMQPEAVRRDPRAQIFLAKGCPQCHDISALNITSPSKAGPDLTLAVTDVQDRFGVTLEQFLHAPTGTMQIVLSGQISLSPAERDSIIGLLRSLSPRP